MENITKQKLEEVLRQFTLDFLETEKIKRDIVSAIISKTAEQSQLNTFHQLEQKLGVYMQFLSSAIDSIRAEVTQQLQIANAAEYASKLGIQFDSSSLQEAAHK